MDELTDSVIDELKVKYGDIYLTSLENRDFIFRALTIAENSIITDHKSDDGWSSADAEEQIVLKAVIWPENITVDSFKKAGSIATLAEEIVYTSGFSDTLFSRDILENSRIEMGNLQGSMMSIVLLAMPSYKYEDLLNLTFKQLADRVALAENIIYFSQTTQGLEVEQRFKINIRTPEEIEAELAQPLDKGIATKGDPVAQRLAKAMRENM